MDLFSSIITWSEREGGRECLREGGREGVLEGGREGGEDQGGKERSLRERGRESRTM